MRASRLVTRPLSGVRDADRCLAGSTTLGRFRLRKTSVTRPIVVPLEVGLSRQTKIAYARLNLHLRGRNPSGKRRKNLYRRAIFAPHDQVEPSDVVPALRVTLSVDRNFLPPFRQAVLRGKPTQAAPEHRR